MKLKSLRLHGFKSFADRTEIDFHDGITAIVGPNGCGKSNISDAVRWVLGEQRPTAIRGAKMEEAIFQGTVNRRPVNRGSVTIEVTNEDGVLPVPFQEVEIARSVYRDGGSEYFLNRSGCRLKDIQELCRDTGLGANAYAVIENRMIDAILSDRDEERRGLFEEAAGIGKYKDRRRAASRRLERAEIDLQRLEDLIGEVQSKVRSLARQKGKAERYGELRDQRLDLEVALAQGQLNGLEVRLREVRTQLAGDLGSDEGLRSRVAAAEARQEGLRVELLKAERERSVVAQNLDALREELVRWERELAVAQERSGQAERRLAQIVDERAEALTRVAEAKAAAEEVQARRTRLDGELEGLRERIELHQRGSDEIRASLEAARAKVDEVAGRDRELARRVVQLEGDVQSGQIRAQEITERIRHLEEELAESESQLQEARSQGDLFADRVLSLEEERQVAGRQLEQMEEALDSARKAFQEAREAEREAQDRYSDTSTRLSALQRMESDREGVDPVARALLAQKRDGVYGLLADFLRAEPDAARAVEGVLGVLLRAIVVRDAHVAQNVATWFREEWAGGGGLVLLPADRVQNGTMTGTLIRKVSTFGEGGPWVRALLNGVALVDAAQEGSQASTDRPLDDVEAMWADQNGVLRIGSPSGDTGILERKEELRVLSDVVERSKRESDEARKAREEAEQRVTEAEQRLESSRAALRAADDSLREARAREEARSERLVRMERTVQELEGQLSASRVSKVRILERIELGSGERDALSLQERDLGEERTAARERLDAVQIEWDEAREEGSRLTVDLTRCEGEIAGLNERRVDLARIEEAGTGRLNALDAEQQALQDAVRRDADVRAKGTSELERLFEQRTDAERELQVKDESLSALREAVAEAEGLVKDARTSEREAAERRHGLELEAKELENRVERIRDRLEAEWDRDFTDLVADARPVDSSQEDWRSQLSQVLGALERLGPVNMLAVEEHEEERARLSFLSEQRDDLVEARDDLTRAISEINATATRLFLETFEAIRENFRSTFLHLFEGGECDLWLDDPEDPLESDVVIQAAPQGKRTQRIELLSGGERALTALSLLFGIYLVKPSPFCVLDEVDAPLDEANIGRFIRLLQQFKERTQFVVITHNPRTIEAADWIYGVTMEELGVSSIVGVRLDEALEVAGAGV